MENGKLTIAQVKQLAAALHQFAQRAERLDIQEVDFALMVNSPDGKAMPLLVSGFVEDDKNAFFYLETAAQ